MAYQWAIEKKLTILGNSDVHSPIQLTYDSIRGQQRPMTLVFAKDKSAIAIKEALLARRSAVYHNDWLIGEEQFLKPIFEGAIVILNPQIAIKGTGRAIVQLQNRSDLCFDLTTAGDITEISFPETVKLYPQRIVALQINGKLKTLAGKKKFSLPFRVANLFIGPDQGLPVELDFEVNFTPVQ